MTGHIRVSRFVSAAGSLCSWCGPTWGRGFFLWGIFSLLGQGPDDLVMGHRDVKQATF